tara:strand:+ start:9323 stop:9550 length:228 start_codon:yes stop_codon:yes gene_type:complete
MVKEYLGKEYFHCNRCGETRTTKVFLFKSLVTEDQWNVCEPCAYKETYGTKGWRKALKDNKLERLNNGKNERVLG